MRCTWLRPLWPLLGLLVACSDNGLKAELERQEVRLGEAQSLAPDAHLALGAKVFAARCSVCHGRDGRGAAAIPPLRGHVSQLTATKAGRRYAAGVVVHGINGAIKVDTREFYNMMPGLGSQLDDEAIAGALNFALLVLDEAPLTAKELVTTHDVVRERKARRTPQQHLTRRPALAEDTAAQP